MPSRSNFRFRSWTLMGWSSTTRMEGAAIGCGKKAGCRPGSKLLRAALAERLDRVLEQHRHGHRPHAAGNRGNFRAERGHGGEMNVAGESVTGFLGRVGDAVNTHIDHDGAGLDHVGRDELGAA